MRRSGAAPSSLSSPADATWTQLDGSPLQDTRGSLQDATASPAARSGHAMTLLPPTRSVLLFGGADGKVFFEDIFLLEPARFGAANATANRVSTRSSSRGVAASQQAADDFLQLRWKGLVVSHTTSCNGASPLSPIFSAGYSNSASPGGSGLGAPGRGATFLHPGAGRDYHTIHYVQCSEEDERTRGMRVLVVGNVVVASDEAARDQGGGGTQSEGGIAASSTMAFDMQTLRVEELRVRQPLLEARWEARRMDAASMWKPKARHAHSSVVVGGDQLFVFGGKDAASSTFFNDIFYYDAPLNQWVDQTGKTTGQLPQARAFAGLTASDDGNTLFLFGGTDGKQEFGSLFLYDVVHMRWDSLAGATSGDRPSCRINHSFTFAAPNHLVLFGGRRRAVRQNELFICDVNARTWRRVPEEKNDGLRDSQDKSCQTAVASMNPIGRTAHATVLYRAEPAGPNAVQKFIIFGGYAGSHRWLADLHLLSLPQAALVQPPPAKSSSRPSTTSQSTRPYRAPYIRRGSAPTAHVSLSAPQQQILSRQLSQSAQQKPQSIGPLVQASSTQIPQQVSDAIRPPQQPSAEQPQRSQQTSQQAESLQQHSQPQPCPRQLLKEPQAPSTVSMPSVAATNSPPRPTPRSDAPQIASAGSVLTDITNQPESASLQQQSIMPRSLTDPATTGSDTTSSSAVKKHKRRRLTEDSQDSNNSNSNSSNGSGELTAAQVGMQTTLLQLLQRQPRVEDTLARILSLLTREQTARQQQSLNQETMMRVHSEEQSKRLEAAARRNEALEGRLARAEADRAALHEKLMARETELYMHKHSLEAAIPPLNSRVQAIESSHIQQLTVARVIESKISAVHDFMDELRCVGGEGTALDDSPLQHQGRLDDNAATQPTPSPPKLLYPQRVVLALEEKLRVIQLEKEALEAKVKELSDRVQRAEGREAQARQFFFSWCQSDNTLRDEPSAAISMEHSATTTALTAHPQDSQCTNIGTAKTDS